MRLAAVVLALLAPAAAPPAATTGAASSVAQTSATVAASVDPHGSATSYRFEYGTSSSYGLQTADGDAGMGDGAVAVSAPLTGLTPGTTYHYRVVATNVAGATPGADRTLTTAAASASPTPPRASTGGVRTVTATGATLTASVDPDRAATSAVFEYGTTTSYGNRTPAVGAGSGDRGVAVSATIGRLKPYTRYHYRVVATNAAGVTSGRDRSFRTLRNPQGITAAASPNPAPWGGSAKLAGRLTGQGIAGSTVVLERQDFPFARPYYVVGSRSAGRDGSFSFGVGPLWSLTRLRVSTRTTIVATSPIVEVRSALRVGLRAHPIAGRRTRLEGAVSPAVPRGLAALQRRSPRGRWVTVRRAGVRPLRGGRSRYRFTVRRNGSYRVVVLPRDAFAHVRGASRARRVGR